MPITLDDKQLHRWARENGYVRWSEMNAFALSLLDVPAWTQTQLNSAAALVELDALEQPEDLESNLPLTRADVTKAFRELVARPRGTELAVALLDNYGVKQVKDLPGNKLAEVLLKIREALS
jgi:hypothetical protein